MISPTVTTQTTTLNDRQQLRFSIDNPPDDPEVQRVMLMRLRTEAERSGEPEGTTKIRGCVCRWYTPGD